MQSGLLKRIEEKENERDSFELQISNVNLSHIDEREKNMVRMTLPSDHACFPVFSLNEKIKNIQVILFQLLQRIEVERKTSQLAQREFESNIRQKQSELYGIEQNIKAVNREKDIMAGDSEDRVKLSLKKAELEIHKKKQRKMQVKSLSFLFFLG